MKTKSVLLIAIGALALFVLVAFPGSAALAACGQVDDVDVIWEYGPEKVIYFELSVAGPTGANIYYTTTLNNTEPPNPTWNTATGAPTGTTMVCYSCTTRDVQIPYGYTMNIKAQAGKIGIPCWYPSVNIIWDYQHNPNL